MRRFRRGFGHDGPPRRPATFARPRMKGTHIVLLVLGLGATGAIVRQALQPKPPVLVVTTVVERLPTVRSVVEGTGEIRAKEFVDIQAEVPGVIVELLVREGDHVKT